MTVIWWASHSKERWKVEGGEGIGRFCGKEVIVDCRLEFFHVKMIIWSKLITASSSKLLLAEFSYAVFSVSATAFSE